MILLRDVAKTEDCTLSFRQTLGVAITTIAGNDVGAVIVDDKNRPIGILTERDVVRLLDAGTPRDILLEAFRKPLTCAHGDRTLIFGANLMLDRNIRRIVVVDDLGGFAGLVTQDEVVKHLEDEIYQASAKVYHVLYNRRPLVTLSPGARLSDAVSVMTEHDIGSVVLIADERAVGIVTERDIVRLASRGTSLSVPLSDVMSAPVITSSIDASVTDLRQLMQEKRIRRVVVLGGDGNVLGIITNRDLLRNVEGSYTEFLKHKLHHVREILDALPEIVMEVVDVGGDSLIQWCNKRTIEEFRRNPVDQPVSSLIAAEEWSSMHAALLDTGKVERRALEISGRIYEIVGSCAKLFKENIFQFILRDVTDELRRSATDFLTNLHNRRKMDEILDTELGRVSRYGRPLSLLLFDIDNFKGVNDTYGHPQGDRVLQEVARLVSQVVRRTDFLGRYGGDEFLIVSPELPGSTAAKLAERARGSVEAHQFEGVGRVTISMGVASYVHGDTRETLAAKADAALYRAKEQGRNRVEFFESPSDEVS